MTDLPLLDKWARGGFDFCEVVHAGVALTRGLPRRIVPRARRLTRSTFLVGESRALLDLHRSSRAALSVLEALVAICPRLPIATAELADALALAELHALTVYDAAYAAVARSRHGRLATLDRLLLGARLGERPSEIVSGLSA